MESRASVKISRDPEVVFPFTTEHVAEWSSIVVSDEVTHEAPNMVGTKFRTVTVDRGCRMEFEGEVVEHDFPRKHRAILTGEKFDMDVTYLFEEKNGDTIVTQIADISPKKGMKVFFFFFGWLFKRSGCEAAQKELNHLKSLLENADEARK